MGPEGPVTTCRGFRPVFSRDPSEWSRLPLRVHPANARPWPLVPASQPPRLYLRPTGNSQPRAYRGVLVPETLTHCDDSAKTGWASLSPTPPAPTSGRCCKPWALRAAHHGSCRSVWGGPSPGQHGSPGTHPGRLGWR